ncbi:MAG: chondroitinase-B domain-containing protein [Opitutales bacterium]
MNLVRLFLFSLFLSALASAKTHQVGPSDNWFGLLHGGGLQPGDEVILKAGTYSNARMLVLTHVGTADHPIVIRAAEGARVVFRRPDARQNTFNLAGTQHLKLIGFEITGGSAAIRIYKQGNRMAKFVTLEGLHIHHVGEVAVTCNNVGNTYEGMIFRRNHVHHTSGTGEAFYLGSNSGPGGRTQTQFFHGVIEGNYIHDLKGPKVSQ